MKTARRHELKENDLAQQIAAAGDTFRQYGLQIAAAIVAVVAVFVAMRLYTASRDNARTAAWKLLQTTLPGIAPNPQGQISKLIELADAGHGQAVASRAVARAAEAAVVGMQDARTRDDRAAADELLKQAEQLYQRLERDFPADANAVGIARLGQGFTAEERGDWDAARKVYEAIKSDAMLSKTPMPGQAEYRLANLDRWRQPVVFAPPLPPATQAASAPMGTTVTADNATTVTLTPPAASQPAAAP